MGIAWGKRRLLPLRVNVCCVACKQILMRCRRRTSTVAMAGMAQKRGCTAPPPRSVFQIGSGTKEKVPSEDRGRRKRLHALFWPARTLHRPENEPRFSNLRKCPEYPGSRAPGKPPPSEYPATLGRVARQPLASLKRPSSYPQATLKRPSSVPRATLRALARVPPASPSIVAPSAARHPLRGTPLCIPCTPLVHMDL